VRDTGIGIPIDKQQHIFEAFTQADSSTTREYGGTGLGLTISAQLVALMGGRMWVESAVGRGSAFHFTVRLGVQDEPPGEAPVSATASSTVKAPLPGDTAPGQHKLRILLAEDNMVNQKLAVRLLEKWGHAVTVATNGKKALAALEQQAFDLVLMDVQMPEMDGLEATQEIRAREMQRLFSHVPIVAMTAHAMTGDRERCLAAGMDSYIAKPLQPEDLRAVIESVMVSK
jgi:CheY-like chemotaxis protein